jgi:hypothetical protein
MSIPAREQEDRGAPKARAEIEDDDALDELPPLDGDAADAPEPEMSALDSVEDIDDDDASLDDTTGEDERVDSSELDLDDEEGGWIDEPSESPDLDLGDAGLIDFADEEADGSPQVAEQGADWDDASLEDGPERGDLDGGDEGPVSPDEELREEDLPLLDSDEAGDLDEASLLDAGFAADEPLGLAWAAEPWSRVGAPVPLASATAVACVLRGALVAGRSEAGVAELSQVDLEGAVQGLAAAGLDISDVRSLDVERDAGRALDAPTMVAVTEGGQAFVSRDGGATFVLLGAEAGSDAAVPAQDSHVLQAVIANGTVWLHTRPGELLAVVRSEADKERTARIERCDVGGRVAAIARDSAPRIAAVAAIAIDDDGRPVAIVRGLPDGSLVRERADGPESKAPALLAIRSGHVAYAGQRGGVARSLGGAALAAFVWEGRVTALSFVDDGGTLVAATYSEVDDTTALVKLDADGRASVVARIGPSHPDTEADGRVLAMAHDEARGVVWVAGAFGVAAFAVR